MDHSIQQQQQQQQQHRQDWAASPTPPLWTHSQTKRDVPSVDPAAHARVRAFPSSQDNQEQEWIRENGLGNEKEDRDNDNDDEDGDNQENGLCTELKALPPSFQLVAPQPRRVVSPELIFSSAAESLSRHKRLRFSAPNATLFRPIVANRPDLEITSPPMRSANPVVMDSRFQRMTKRDLRSRDAKEAPVQPFYPRATRIFPPRS